MNIENKLKEKFNQITAVLFEKEGNFNFLRVEVSLKDLDEIAKLSREISNYLDDEDAIEVEYFLDVYSSGTDKVLEISEFKDNLNKNILVTVREKVKNYDSFEGELLSVEDEKITVRWNAKGQFRKQEIEISNIKELKLYAKTK